MRRGEEVERLLRAPQNLLFDACNTSGLGEAEMRAAFDLMARFSRLRKNMSAAASEAEEREIERHRLRPALADLRDFALRHNLTAARPFWGARPVRRNPGALAYVGGRDVAALVADVCADLGLSLETVGGGWGAGRKLWRSLRVAEVAALDLRRDSVEAPEAAYALGLALALGRPVVVLADASAALPFNFDIHASDASDATSLHAAIDATFFRVEDSAEEDDGGVAATLAHLAETTRGWGATTQVYAQRVRRGDYADPIEARGVAESLIADGRNEQLVLTPLWPAAYPDPKYPSAFHVMPFGHDWCNGARDAARAACMARGIAYERGDETGVADVVSGIWGSISRARLVIVDVTGLNLNVCMELGFAHALGRPTLILRRAGSKSFFAAIAKLQLHEYSDADFDAILDRFLSAGERLPDSPA